MILLITVDFTNIKKIIMEIVPLALTMMPLKTIFWLQIMENIIVKVVDVLLLLIFITKTGPSCHNLTCAGGELKIKIGNIWYDCDSDNQLITVTGGGVYKCPSSISASCASAPSYSSWITFNSISPTKGKAGTTVKISVTGLSSTQVVNVGFGKDFSCSNSSFEFTEESSDLSISCKLQKNANAFSPLKSTSVDVYVTDVYGRTTTGLASFTISDSTRLASISLFMLASIALLVLG